ncbi:MAG: HIT domain-containing protein [Candidatus Gracilibacteria bacterium]|nr:HIT domain-containing protein [Candidatus Gracilibacteria bacterium]
MDNKCIFCKDIFPLDYQNISDEPKYWTFVHDIKPICDFHCNVILKKEVSGKEHICDLGDEKIPDDVLSELGIVLNKSVIAIKKSSEKIKRVNIVSLNSGSKSKHLHFHLIPIFEGEDVKKINDINTDGGGLSFLSRKEIVQDTLDEFINQTCGELSSDILTSIEIATKKRVSNNVILLKKYFSI